MDFFKYEGAGNDFILVDDRKDEFPSQNNSLVKLLCDRRFGIGADGLMLLRLQSGYDFGMVYFNSDGHVGSMCGNGGRCIAAFARRLGIIGQVARFMAADGEHIAALTTTDHVKLKMRDVSEIEIMQDAYILNTGSPHYVRFVKSVKDIDVFAEGRKIRYHERFSPHGTNVNFVEDHGDHVVVRTYERGVENETLACGTGVVASVICTALRRIAAPGQLALPVKVMGGQLGVALVREQTGFTDIWLEGPATFVFRGSIELP